MGSKKDRAAAFFFLLSSLLPPRRRAARANHADCEKALQSLPSKPSRHGSSSFTATPESDQHTEVHGVLAEIKDKLIFIEDYLLYYEAEAAARPRAERKSRSAFP